MQFSFYDVHIIDHYVAFHVIVSCSEQITEEEKNAKIYKTNFTKHKQFEKMQNFENVEHFEKTQTI